MPEGGGRADVRIGGQGCCEAVQIGVGPFLDVFIVVFGGRLGCHLVPEVVLAERWKGAGIVGIGVGIIGEIVFQVNKDHHGAM